MQLEHCENLDSGVIFETSNYQIKTTPQNEWKYIFNPELCPHEQTGSDRKIKNVDELMKEKASTGARLIRAEVIAVVLFTGPMVSCALVLQYQCILGKIEATIYLYNLKALWPALASLN